MLKLLVFHVLLISSPLVLAQPIRLTESALLEMAVKGSPQLDQIHATLLASALKESELREDYAPEIFGEARHSETHERAIIPFQPVFSLSSEFFYWHH